MVVFERGWLSSNNILFRGDGQACLVDSGYCTHAAQTIALVKTSLGDAPLGLLVNTHLHSDHCGGNAALQQIYPYLETRIPPGETSAVETWDTATLSYDATGQLCPRFRFDHVLRPGSCIKLGVREWEVHAATGHDPHSVILFEPNDKILISADALWENGFGVVFPELDGIEAFADVDLTLGLIEQLSPKVVIPGHGGVFEYSPEVLKRARTRLNRFIDDPVRHARHAAKVLIKFKLLEVQRFAEEELLRWASHTPLIVSVHRKFFSATPFGVWMNELYFELQQSAALRRENGFVVNI
jgi:glyoxylase-like metal-dependent hydrolase (beta-lactamase superfamily II)